MSYKTEFQSNNNDLRSILERLQNLLKDPIEDKLVDFNYTKNADGTYTLTGWKGTLYGNPSTEVFIPDDSRILF